MICLSRTAHIICATGILISSLALLPSCTVRQGSSILKVNPYHLQPGSRPNTEEEKIIFDYRRKVYGAVDNVDLNERYGNYFTVFWHTENSDSPVTVRLHYRQAETGPKIFIEEQTVGDIKRTNTTNFDIIGEDYSKRGAVTQWKAAIIQNGAVVDEFKSFLWQ